MERQLRTHLTGVFRSNLSRLVSMLANHIAIANASHNREDEQRSVTESPSPGEIGIRQMHTDRKDAFKLALLILGQCDLCIQAHNLRGCHNA